MCKFAKEVYLNQAGCNAALETVAQLARTPCNCLFPDTFGKINKWRIYFGVKINFVGKKFSNDLNIKRMFTKQTISHCCGLATCKILQTQLLGMNQVQTGMFQDVLYC